MVRICKSKSHGFEKVKSLIVLSIQWITWIHDVPVNQTIDSKLASPFNVINNLGLPIIGFIVVSSLSNIHGYSDKISLPVSDQGGETLQTITILEPKIIFIFLPLRAMS